MGRASVGDTTVVVGLWGGLEMGVNVLAGLGVGADTD